MGSGGSLRVSTVRFRAADDWYNIITTTVGDDESIDPVMQTCTAAPGTKPR